MLTCIIKYYCNIQTKYVYLSLDMLQTDGLSLIPPVPSLLLSDPTLGIYMTQCLGSYMNPPNPSAVICL